MTYRKTTGKRDRRRRLTGAAATLAAASVLLTGCNNTPAGDLSPDDSPATSVTTSPVASPPGSGDGSPSSSTPSTPEASPTPEPATSTSAAKNIPVPKMPDAVKEPTKEGMEATLVYWFEANNFLMTTGNSSPLKAVSSPDCIFCEDLITNWTGFYRDGGWAAVGPVTVDVDLSDVEPDNRGTVIFSTTSTGGEAYEVDGSPIPEASSEGKENQPWSGSLAFDEERGLWIVESLTAFKDPND